MKVRLAKTAGFCWGVRRAMDMVLKEANVRKETIYTFGPLIHNEPALSMLRARGVEVKQDSEDLKDKTLVIRTHGITPEVRSELKSKDVKLKDATCPYVAQVQGTIKKHIALGYSIVIVGDKNHPEVIGHMAYSKGKGVVISNLQDLDGYKPEGKVCIVAQTTQSEKKFNLICEEIKKRAEDVVVVNTICDDTIDRQGEVGILAKQVDAMVIVGGKNSANTKHLQELTDEAKIPSVKIETDQELSESWLKQFNSIGVMAGASTPNWMIEKVVDRIERVRGEKDSWFTWVFSSLVQFIFKSNIFLAAGAASLSYVSCRIQKIEPSMVFHLIAGFYIFSMHLLNHFTDRDAIKLNEPARLTFYERHRKLLIFLGIASSIGTLIISFTLGFWPFIVVLISLSLGTVYRINILPRIKLKGKLLQGRKLSQIPASKDLFLSLAWVLITVILPPFSVIGKPVSIDTLIAGIFVFVTVFLRSVIFDIKDIEGDMVLGKETIPIILGKEKTKSLLIALASVLIVAILIYGFTVLQSQVSILIFLLLIPTLYSILYLYLFHKRIIYRGILFEAVVDSSFLLSGILSFLWYHL